MKNELFKIFDGTEKVEFSLKNEINYPIIMSELHYLFSDESGYIGESRHGSIAVVSGSKSATKEINDFIKKSLGEKTEIKFSTISSRKHQEIAKYLINKSIEFIRVNKLKICVIVWDKQDSRHDIPNRCDIRNLIIMYYRVLRHSIKNWSSETNWAFYPDQQTSIDWGNLINIVTLKQISSKEISSQTLFDFFNESIFPIIKTTRELDSKDFPIIQLADLFAGIARTSREHSILYHKWRLMEDSKTNPSLFPEHDIDIKISNSKIVKFEILHHFYEQSRHYRLGINFSENSYFKTYDPSNSLNFWHYKPQGEYDKAPTKH